MKRVTVVPWVFPSLVVTKQMDVISFFSVSCRSEKMFSLFYIYLCILIVPELKFSSSSRQSV